jgi:hypothetical protein
MKGYFYILAGGCGCFRKQAVFWLSCLTERVTVVTIREGASAAVEANNKPSQIAAQQTVRHLQCMSAPRFYIITFNLSSFEL